MPEALQCMTERRRGGETGVVSVRCVTGSAGLGGGESWSLVAARCSTRWIRSRQSAFPHPRPIQPRPDDALFLINYRDETKGWSRCWIR